MSVKNQANEFKQEEIEIHGTIQFLQLETLQ